MKILVFTEGTVLLPQFTEKLSREEIVTLNKANPSLFHDFANYSPHGDSVEKLKKWQAQGAEILYISSRKVESELNAIRNVLVEYDFPSPENLYYKLPGEEYKDVAERLIPDVLIEDDCESIGGEKEMVHPHIKPDIKQKIKSIIVKEFEGIDHLSEDINEL